MTRSRKTVTRLSNSGFTLLDIMLAVLVVSLILGIGVPSFNTMLERRKAVGLAEQLASHIMLVRSEAIARSQQTYFRVQVGAGWIYGLSTNDNCDLNATAPAAVNACVLVVDDGDALIDPGDGSVDTGDLVLNRFDATEHPDLSVLASNFSGAGGQIGFDPVRGTSDSGDITIVSAPSGYQLRVKVGMLGDVRICSPNNDLGYSQVDC